MAGVQTLDKAMAKKLVGRKRLEAFPFLQRTENIPEKPKEI